MKRYIIGALALFIAAPAAAQVTANLPVTCNASGTICVQAQPVSNPDGTTIQKGDATGSFVVTKGSATIATGQVSVTTTATLVSAQRAGRQKITVTVGAANTCAFGPAGVTLSTGFPLQPVAGASLAIETAAAIYAVCSGTTTVGFLEQY